MLFEFQNSAKRLQLCLIIGPGDDDVRKFIHQAVKEFPIFSIKKKFSPKYATIYVKRFLDSKDYTGPDLEAMIEKVEKAWSEFLAHDLPAIHQVIDDLDWPDVSEAEQK
ncbi:MAG: hypothetical protein JW934_08105 [Anaerolineae bacterium]|nr:hypothetical protein [Anaerolineae bacterium]